MRVVHTWPRRSRGTCCRLLRALQLLCPVSVKYEDLITFFTEALMTMVKGPSLTSEASELKLCSCAGRGTQVVCRCSVRKKS
jgi:hypothetical protein